MEDFLGKYYPGIKRRLHEQRIDKLARLLEQEKTQYKKIYNEIYTD